MNRPSPDRHGETADRRIEDAACLGEDLLLDLVEGRRHASEPEIASHLDACEACRALLAQIAPGNDEGSPQPRPGERIGRYEVLELVGAGATGLVYAALDPELGRKVALKLLRPADGGDPLTLQARLLREAQALARLSHPNVVAVHDVLTARGQVFLAMALIEGGTLTEWLAAAQRSWREVVEVFRQAGEGLAAAHAVGLVHRDFKPDNVMIGERGEVRVADFGLARWDEAPATTAPAPSNLELTRTGALVGTPAFMAPEQLAGRPADARSDLFSFCASLHLALCGERPFAGESVADLSAAIAQGQVREVPPGRKVPGFIRRAIARGLAVDPERRFPSMQALLTALQRDPRRHVRWAVPAAFATLALVVALPLAARPKPCVDADARWGAIWNAEQQASARAVFQRAGTAGERLFAAVDQGLSAYHRAWVAMHQDACEATQVRHDQSEALLDLRMRCLDDRRREADRLVQLLTTATPEVVAQASAAVGKLPGIDGCANLAALTAVVPPPRDPAAQRELAQLSDAFAELHALYLTGQYARGATMSGPVLERARRLGYRPIWAKLALVDANLGESVIPLAQTVAQMQEAGALAVEAHDDATAADAWTRVAFVVGFLQNHPDDAEPWLRLARASIERLGGDDLREAERLWARCTIDNVAQRWEEGLTLAEEARRLYTRARGPDYFRLPSVEESIGIMLEGEGKLDEAFAAYERSRVLRVKLLGPTHPHVHNSLANEAEVRRLAGRADEAIALVHAALDLNPEDGARDPYCHTELASSLRAAGRFAEALPEDQLAEKLRLHDAGPNGWRLSEPLVGEGLDLLALGRPQEALAPLEHAMSLRARDNPPDAEVRFALARALWETHGDRARARKLATEAAARLDPLAAKYGSYYRVQAEAVDQWLARHPLTVTSARRAAAGR